MDIRLALMAGTDIPMPEIQLTAHQPRIKEIALIGEPAFFSSAQCLCLRKEQIIEDKFILSKINNFQVFMKVMQQQKDSEKKNALITLLSLLFPSHQTLMTPQSIIFRCAESGESKLIDENNFDIFQDYLRQILCISAIFQQDITYNPANEAAQAIVDKLKAGRRKRAEIRSKEKEKYNDSIIARYISILTIGLNSMSLSDLLDLTLYQLFDLVERYTLWLDWDIDLRSRLAGATPKKEAENWMKSLYSEENSLAFTSKDTSNLIKVYNK